MTFFLLYDNAITLTRPDNTPRDRHTQITRERSHIAPPPSIREVAPRATWHKHITGNKPPRKGLYTRKGQGRRTLALEQQLHFLLHRGHNNATRPVVHQTGTPPHRVRDAVAHPTNELLGTLAQTPHHIHPEGKKGDLLVCTRLRVSSVCIQCLNLRIPL